LTPTVGRPFSISYLADQPAAHAFFPPAFLDPAERVGRARLAASRAVSPELVAELAAQQGDLSRSPARQAHLHALAKGGCAVVVTGQQVGLFLGPLYSFYKAASAVAVARAIARESGVPCVPLFWLQTEDHDFAEIATCVVSGPDGAPLRLVLPDEENGQGRASVAYRVLPAQIGGLLDGLAQALPPTPAAAETLALLRSAYQPGRTVAAAFAEVMAALFAEEGLLIFDPRQDTAAALAAPVYRKSIEDADAIREELEARGAALAAAGFAEQVAIRERGALVFFHRDHVRGPRFRLERPGAGADSGRWTLAGGGAALPHEEVLATLAREPLRFSSSTLLRPIVQDTLWPTVAYLGGPGEINYFAQLPPLYRRFGLPPPLLVPRTRFRCLDPRTRRNLDALGLAPADLQLPAAELQARIPLARPDGAADPTELRAEVRSRILPAVERLADAVVAVDPDLRRSAGRARASVAYQLERLVARYARRLLERDQVTARRLRGLELALNPERTPQERYYGWPAMAGRYGVRGFKQLVQGQLHDPFATAIRDLEP
jgi:bacillithiol synthase